MIPGADPVNNLSSGADPPGERKNREKKARQARKRGGQPGYGGKSRELVPPEKVSKFVDVFPAECENCWSHYRRCRTLQRRATSRSRCRRSSRTPRSGAGTKSLVGAAATRRARLTTARRSQTILGCLRAQRPMPSRRHTWDRGVARAARRAVAHRMRCGHGRAHSAAWGSACRRGLSRRKRDGWRPYLRNSSIKRYGTQLTYEERRDASAKVMAEVLWADAEKDLKQQVTDEGEVEIDGRRYRRLAQPSSAVYYGRWGQHEVEEALYREIGIHNGATIKRSNVGSA
jgi:hypothetical protein